MGISFLIAMVIVIGYFFYLSKKQANDIKDKQITEEAFKYEKHGIGSILIVKKKSSIAASNLTVLAHREIFTKDVPDRIVYTGVTVGGITTGGFHIQKGGTVWHFLHMPAAPADPGNLPAVNLPVCRSNGKGYGRSDHNHRYFPGCRN